MKLIDDWPRAWRLFSVQAATVAVAFGALPSDMQASILEMLHVPANRVPAIIGLLVLAGRLLSQEPK